MSQKGNLIMLKIIAGGAQNALQAPISSLIIIWNGTISASIIVLITQQNGHLTRSGMVHRRGRLGGMLMF
jgi:hypothetical protein